jgi:hypothetical protein
MDLLDEILGDVRHHHHHHHRARLNAPTIHSIDIDFKGDSMNAIAGVTVPTISIVLTLPIARTDGTAAQPSDIASATVLRDPGTGPVTLQVINGPFTGSTVTAADTTPATGSDIYSFFCTDQEGTVGLTSAPVTVTVTGVVVLAPLAAGTLTAVANTPGATPAVPVNPPLVPSNPSINPVPNPTPINPSGTF